MKIPDRYIDIKNHFDGLQIMNELADTNKISIESRKFKDSFQISIRTSLGIYDQPNNLLSEKSIKFNVHEFSKNVRHYYFPFTISLERFEDNVTIETYLPDLTVNKEKQIEYHGKPQMMKMYENSLILELHKRGFRRANIINARKGFILNFELGSTQNHENIMKVYDVVKRKCTEVFELLR